MICPIFRDYKLATACEAPTLENVKVFIVESPLPDGPFGAKGTGEVTVNATGLAIANAIYNATGIRIKDAPATAERIWRALRETKSAQVFNK
jgi:CO/xanthine dehydrogenase Mo-binding subunit